MLRVHFTTDDLARVRVAAAPDPLWEIATRFQVLISADAPLLFGEWRRFVRPRVGAVHGLLAALLPPRGYFPDFLTPDLRGSFDPAHAVDTVLGTPRARPLALADLTPVLVYPSTPSAGPGEPMVRKAVPSWAR